MNASLASVLSALAPLIVFGLAALCAWVGTLVARHIKDRRYALAVELAAYGAAAIVADMAQTVVEGLKDPSRPGTWNATTASAMRLRAVARVRALYPNAVATIARVLVDPSKVDELLGTLIERAVVDGKRGPSAVAVASESITVETGARPTVAPPARLRTPTRPDDPQAGRVTGEALLWFAGALFCIALAGALAFGCRPNLPPVSGCTVGSQSCEADRPRVCSASQRWQPAGDLPCSRVGGTCVVTGGVAHCAPVDGGVR